MSKNPWGEGTPWKNQSAFMTYLRGCLRKAWNTHPAKLNTIKRSRKQVPNPNPRGNKKTVWGFDCGLCESTYVIGRGRVDHINPAGALREKGDIQGFVERLLFVREDDLRLICEDCNSILAYADKHNITFEEARIEKKAIAFCKLPIEKQKNFLLNHGVKPLPSNAKARREAYKQLILNGTIE